MIFSLSAEALSQSYRAVSYEVVTSTNDLAFEFAKNGDKGHLWIVAAEQTNGRGRRGRVWQSPKENLYATLLLCDNFTAQGISALGFVAGVALIEALRSVLPQELCDKNNILLKWPNDVLAGSDKLAGILPECIPMPHTENLSFLKKEGYAAAVGIGVNVGVAPCDTVGEPAMCQAKHNTAIATGEKNNLPYPICSLQSIGAAVSPQDVFYALSRFWAENYTLWDNGRGMADICRKWLRYSAHKGKEVCLTQRGETVCGIFETIDISGRLVLRQKTGGTITVSAGDVAFGTAASIQSVI